MKPSLYIARITQVCDMYYSRGCEKCPLFPPYENDYKISNRYGCVDYLLIDNPLYLKNKVYLSYLNSIINKYNLDCDTSYYAIYNAINVKYADDEHKNMILDELRRVGREP